MAQQPLHFGVSLFIPSGRLNFRSSLSERDPTQSPEPECSGPDPSFAALFPSIFIEIFPMTTTDRLLLATQMQALSVN